MWLSESLSPRQMDKDSYLSEHPGPRNLIPLYLEAVIEHLPTAPAFCSGSCSQDERENRGSSCWHVLGTRWGGGTHIHYVRLYVSRALMY